VVHQVRSDVRGGTAAPTSTTWRQVAPDEVLLKIRGKHQWLWRAVDQDGLLDKPKSEQ
jgi:transposase-like protein